VLTLFSIAVLAYAGIAALVMFEQLASLADRLLPGSGPWVLGGLLLLALALVGYSLWLVMRLPRSLQPPADPDELPAYHAWLQTHLARHPDPLVRDPAQAGDLPTALARLEQQARTMTRETAGGVFLSTALIQNGQLDGLVLLGSQVRLIWRIAQLYRLRPTPRQLWYLYANVASGVLITSSLEELDFAEIVGPVISASGPTMAGAVPGMQGLGNVLAHSLATGAANAFMTLRVGLMAQAYCAPLHSPDATATRYSATTQAARMLKDIVAEQGKRVVRSLLSATGKAVGNAVGAATDGIKRASSHSAQVVGQAVEQAVDGTGQLLRRSSDAVVNGVQQAGSAVGAAAGGIKRASTSAVVGAADGLKRSSSAVVGGVQSAVQHTRQRLRPGEAPGADAAPPPSAP
jgi:hypothetical protein